MKVLQLISSRGLYGAETMLVSLAQSLVESRVRVTAAAFRDAREPHTEVLDFAAAQGVETVIVACKDRFDWKAVRQIRSIVSERDIDVVHSHGYKADFYAYLACRNLRVALVATCHNWPAGASVMRYYAKLDRLFLRAFDRVATPSPAIAKLLLESGVPSGKTSFIGNGVDVGRFWPAEPKLRGESGGGPLIGLVGRLVPGKGGAVLLRAAPQILARFPAAKIIFAGDGPARAELMDLAKDLAIAHRVVFAGACNDMPSVYASLDIVTLPSLEEAMPMCLLEAMAARRAVVATRVGAIPEIVRENVTGRLVEPGDAVGLANAVIDLLNNPAAACRMADAGHEHILKHYSSQAMASAYHSLYLQALSEHCATPLVRGFAR